MCAPRGCGRVPVADGADRLRADADDDGFACGPSDGGGRDAMGVVVVARGLVGGDTGTDDGGGGEAGDGLRRERSSTDGEDPTSCAGSSGSAGCGAACDGRAGTACDVCASGRGRAKLGEDQLFEDQQRADGEDGGERVVVLLQLLLKGTAAIAAAHMAAGGSAQLGEPLGDLAELEANLGAAQLARLGGLGERDARAYE
jgi:hypothetical protein